ncbi:ArdC-like ssDNA-binding domain-containing protein [uncultured Butyricimonas sp.]|uniref:ArdC-like ssDNA-binding domain-containing protein n=1 Tax=uncultured Butyricimonas sp. TaxID=1268785 RepID=UPI0026DD30C6|nr:ArdC-like ssDNA-binding domain-containing protein [uncultured Butyricimonas sp.]
MSKGKQFLETRKQLIEASRLAQKIRNEKGLAMTINEILLQIIYNTDGATEFNTFNQWREKGYTVIKGMKSFTVWGQPLNKQEQEKKKEQKDENDEGEFRYFPVCYLFSDKQVHKLDKTPKEEKEPVNKVKEVEFLDL